MTERIIQLVKRHADNHALAKRDNKRLRSIVEKCGRETRGALELARRQAMAVNELREDLEDSRRLSMPLPTPPGSQTLLQENSWLQKEREALEDELQNAAERIKNLENIRKRLKENNKKLKEDAENELQDRIEAGLRVLTLKKDAREDKRASAITLRKSPHLVLRF
jgi:DNA repair exonuclease SbcCD ATPase subunit